MREAGFEGIWKGHHKEAEYGRAINALLPIVDLCEQAIQRMGVRVSWR